MPANQDGSASAYDASGWARQGIPARRQQLRPTLRSRKGDDIPRERPSKPSRLHCLALPPGTEVSRLCVDNRATPAGSDGQLGLHAASRKASYA